LTPAGPRAVLSIQMDVPDNRIEAVVEGLARAACRDFGARIPTATGEEDPFGQIESGINVLLEDLATFEAERQLQLEELKHKNLELAEQQALTLRELSTPIISVWDGVLALPIIGTVDTERGAQMTEALLNRVASEGASHVVIDITGVAIVDTRTADNFIRMSEAAALLGASCFLTGISPAIAQTFTQLEIKTGRIRMMRRLSDALETIFAELGIARK
jgi:rsbT co-antagonist protein RsbR